MESHRVLIADDHDDFRRGLEALLAATPGRGGRRDRVATARWRSRWPSTSSPTSS